MTPTNLSRTSSQSLSRQSTSDFCVNNLLARDPVSGSVQLQNKPTEIDNESLSINEQIDIQMNKEKSTPIKRPIAENPIRVNDEERLALELAIKRSLEDQHASNIEDNNDVSNTIESSSDSDGKMNKFKVNIFIFLSIIEESDFIDVPISSKPTEPIILSHIINNETNNNSAWSESIELDDESSHSSTAIEDIKMFIDNQSAITNTENNQPELLQSVRKEFCNEITQLPSFSFLFLGNTGSTSSRIS